MQTYLNGPVPGERLYSCLADGISGLVQSKREPASCNGRDENDASSSRHIREQRLCEKEGGPDVCHHGVVVNLFRRIFRWDRRSKGRVMNCHFVLAQLIVFGFLFLPQEHMRTNNIYIPDMEPLQRLVDNPLINIKLLQVRLNAHGLYARIKRLDFLYHFQSCVLTAGVGVDHGNVGTSTGEL